MLKLHNSNHDKNIFQYFFDESLTLIMTNILCSSCFLALIQKYLCLINIISSTSAVYYFSLIQAFMFFYSQRHRLLKLFFVLGSTLKTCVDHAQNRQLSLLFSSAGMAKKKRELTSEGSFSKE